MSKLTKAAKGERKSASDFEQWLSEINLFAQETLSELHEVAGLLNCALACDHHRELEVGNHLSTNSRLESPIGNSGEATPTSESEGDEYLASLQNKLTKQLKSKRSSALPSLSDTPVSDPHTKSPIVGESANRYGDPNATDPSF